jgi:membrane-associated phospholipid phosphatase
VAGALLLVPLVGWSRVHLQVHFLSDVLAGGLLGALIAATVLRAGRRLATTP